MDFQGIVLERGRYLTKPYFLKRDLDNGQQQVLIEGAIYDSNYKLIKASQRKGLGVIPNDASILRIDYPQHDLGEKEFLYLGNYFQQYGHFLLETLPMLSYLLGDNNSKAFFNEMPFGKIEQIRNIIKTPSLNHKTEVLVRYIPKAYLLKAFCKILDIDFSRIRINPTAQKRFTGTGQFIEILDYVCIKASFTVPPRPVYMEDRLLDRHPYKVLLNRLNSPACIEQFSSKNKNMFEKVFIVNEPKFFDKSVQHQIILFFEQHGYTIINPLDYSLQEQINIFRMMRVVAGFCGSSLHNSIFSEDLELIIEIGREGMTQNNPNQKICSDISGAEIVFCEYGNADKIKSTLIDLVRNS